MTIDDDAYARGYAAPELAEEHTIRIITLDLLIYVAVRLV